ncbi:Hypothetical protein NGAL_HAMBI1145_23590 [Neorhizobium galegae bv. officinalis]|uniref:Uncharacterized protein n=1 Tax=Neorhizobium galegae bv. officinalis TaxID=323656 RepID=A0A0T7FHP2_NEOGA|nr:Hypothetical protein NGAL_HAMBI1145_23590 [Neorhizobium galegae bv. officinalis]
MNSRNRIAAGSVHKEKGGAIARTTLLRRPADVVDQNFWVSESLNDRPGSEKYGAGW